MTVVSSLIVPCEIGMCRRLCACAVDDLSEREGYDFKQIRSIAKVEVCLLGFPIGLCSATLTHGM